MEATRDDSVSPLMRSPRSQSPAKLHNTNGVGGDAKAELNGYLSSPLRVSQRLASIPDQELPELPMTPENARPNASPSVRFNPPAPGGFPFHAQPGTSGQSPTNELMNGSAQINGDGGYRLKSTQSTDYGAKGLTKKISPYPGDLTPPDPRSVQFSRETVDNEPTPSIPTKTQTWSSEEVEDAVKDRQSSLFQRLKAIASPASSAGHARNASGTAGFGSPSAAMSPASEREEPRYPMVQVDGSEADVEQDSGEDQAPENIRPKRKRNSNRPQDDGANTAPSTPKTPRFASFLRDHAASTGQSSNSRPSRLPRRSTMTDIPESSRAGVSEDEGKDRIKTTWRRGIEGARGLSYANRAKHADAETPDGPRRPGNFRRITGIGTGDGSPFRMRTDRQNNTSAQRWRQVKAGLKMLGQRKRDERTKVDEKKSAELMAQLLAGTPAALFFASMYQRDEHGHRKIPVLLQQLKIIIPSSQNRESKTGDRHMIFRIELEYGNGPARMNWVISRSLRDFVNLHLKYKVQGQTELLTLLKSEDRHRAKIPRFPRSAFPYLRGARGIPDLDDEGDDEEAPDPQANDTDVSGTDRPGKLKHRRSSFGLPRSKSSFTGADGVPGPGGLSRVNSIAELAQSNRDHFAERQRKKLETYLQQMIRWLIFRPDSTRLCKFLELSALSIRLSAEGGYHGKQGLLTIASRRAVELRKRPLGPQSIVDRHKPRWFLVRHSYVVSVDGPESLNVYDCFLVDSDFTTEKRKKRLRDQTPQEQVRSVTETATHAKQHILRLYNAERKLKLFARNERQLAQFQESVDYMAKNTIWANKQRFGSFAPVRKNVWCRWLVDGRDHMWQVSRAIDNARDCIYIHDWWLSPELYMRRPAAISQKWRLDRLLKRKAEEGVKVFVIVYRNVESAIPIDSQYTKSSLLDLHENICIQRSPNQFRQNQFFWAHHEKLVVVDNMMAFVGGVDLCFGRWDDPYHSLTDDKLTGFEPNIDVPRDAEHCQNWPGKDYSNPRVQDFYALDRPYEEMYDRTKIPRMPWHDIAMQIVGQPARDIGRHFVQRWNYVLRQRVPSRPTPVLIPPPEYEQAELDRLGMTGSCQVQILRSCSSWSIGTPNKTEHSIMNAYCSLIENSEHFVYIENQFYISSCTVEGNTVHNKIGDSLVDRIVLAHERGDKWRACLIIPLMPGFQNSVDSQDGTSIRLIMQCQYRSICRGDTSIFGRLRAKGIEPEDYIQFYALRQWGKIGPRKCLTTEQLYIHAKCMVVDDRSVIIGSANINERSMLGSRDSEVAAIVTDTRMIPSSMGGQPYEVGEFPHTLRKRLMREHLGIDVDAIARREQAAAEAERSEQDSAMERIYGSAVEDFASPPTTPPPNGLTERNLKASEEDVESKANETLHKWVSKAGSEAPPPCDDVGEKPKKLNVEQQHDLDVEGYGFDNMKALVAVGDDGGRDSIVDRHGREVLKLRDAPDSKRLKELRTNESARSSSEGSDGFTAPPRPPVPLRTDTTDLGLLQRSQLPELPTGDDTDIGGPPLARTVSKGSANVTIPLLAGMSRPDVHEDCMTDPLISTFYDEIWHKLAENNTRLYRQVFRCMPDSEVLDWDTYRKFNDYSERFMQSQGLGNSKPKASKDAPDKSGPPGSGEVEMSAALGVLAGGGKRSKGALGGLVDKLHLRPGSRARNVTSPHTQEPDEKEKVQQDAGSRLSDHATAVPSQQDEEIDEKTAQRKADDADVSQDRLRADDASHTRTRTIQYTDTVSSNAGTSDRINMAPETTATQSEGSKNAAINNSTSQKRRRRATTKSGGRPMPPAEEILDPEQAGGLLKLIQGHLVLWPYDWLEKEEKGGNWLYSIDQLAPLEIYD